MKSLQLSSFGAPTDVVELAEVDPAAPGPGQQVVSIEAAPINPSDLNLAATQGPAVLSALTAPSGTPAWKTIPSWYVLGTIDRAIPPAIQLFMAHRIHAHITRVKAGHLSMVADSGVIANVITAAARATS